MTDSLRAAAALADKLGQSFDAILPEAEPVIDCDALAADRVELRQVAGISAGGSLELRPGNYDFGPVRHGPGRLGDGDPDTVGFTLSLSEGLDATIGPGDSLVLVDDEPVVAPTDLAGRMINAGSARFVVARPRPPRRRDGRGRAADIDHIDPWVFSPIPSPMVVGPDGHRLIEQRRRLHVGPDEILHRIDGGRALVWDRGPDHPLFGTAVVAMTDIGIREIGIELSAPAPVSIDLIGSPTMLFGERALQLAVVRHILLALAAASHPEDLRIEVVCDTDDLAFAAELPHGTIGSDARVRTASHTVVVVDGSSAGGDWLVGGGFGEGWSVLGFGGSDQEIPVDADVLTIFDEATMAILGGRGQAPIDGATPVGFASSMAYELSRKLAGQLEVG